MDVLIAAASTWCDRCGHDIPVDAPFDYGRDGEPLCPACIPTPGGTR